MNARSGTVSGTVLVGGIRFELLSVNGSPARFRYSALTSVSEVVGGVLYTFGAYGVLGGACLLLGLVSVLLRRFIRVGRRG